MPLKKAFVEAETPRARENEGARSAPIEERELFDLPGVLRVVNEEREAHRATDEKGADAREETKRHAKAAGKLREGRRPGPDLRHRQAALGQPPGQRVHVTAEDFAVAVVGDAEAHQHAQPEKTQVQPFVLVHADRFSSLFRREARPAVFWLRVRAGTGNWPGSDGCRFRTTRDHGG